MEASMCTANTFRQRAVLAFSFKLIEARTINLGFCDFWICVMSLIHQHRSFPVIPVDLHIYWDSAHGIFSFLPCWFEHLNLSWRRIVSVCSKSSLYSDWSFISATWGLTTLYLPIYSDPELRESYVHNCTPLTYLVFSFPHESTASSLCWCSHVSTNKQPSGTLRDRGDFVRPFKLQGPKSV